MYYLGVKYGKNDNRKILLRILENVETVFNKTDNRYFAKML